MITGVVLARNESRHIVECLQSLQPHVAELLLIDMESEDDTVARARPLVRDVLSHPLVENFDAARNMAIPAARYDWLWYLDADERVLPQTGKAVEDVIRRQGDRIAAITIPFKTHFCGKWIEHSGWWPGYTMARVLKRGFFQFSDRLHGGVEFQGAEVRLPPNPEQAIDHFSYDSIEHYVEKFNRYTSTEARYLREAGQPLDWEAGIRAMVRDLWLYFERNEGIRDGAHGWILAWLAGQYRWFSHAKLLDACDPAAVPQSVPPNLDAVLDVMRDELGTLRGSTFKLPLGVVFRSPIWDASGYADDGRAIASSLAAGEREVAVEPILWSDERCALPPNESTLLRVLVRARRAPSALSITSCIPTLVEPDRGAALNVLRTTFETDRIPENWLPVLSRFDEVWVFSEQSRQAFIRSGAAPERLRIVPAFIDTEGFSARGRKLSLPDEIAGRFVFLSVFDWQWRKGWDLLLRSYCREFAAGDRTALLLKVTGAHGATIERIGAQANDVLREMGQSLQERTDIVIWDALLPSTDVAALYRSADAFVLPSRGEGWGRPYMEAVACGLPVIATKGSGSDAFLSAHNCVLVSAEWVDVPPHAAAEIPVYAGHRWLEPDEAELQSALARVASDQKLRRRIARRGAADVRKHFSIAAGRACLEAAMCAVESRFAPAEPAAVREDDVKVLLEGEFFAGHSFSNINEQVALRLADTDEIALSLHRIVNQPTHDRAVPFSARLQLLFSRELPDGPDVTIRHAFPPNWRKPERGAWVHIQPWEFGHLPREWVRPLRDEVDEVWAPSHYVKRVYERSGVPAEKIQVIPWGIDADLFHADVPARILPGTERFMFLFVGGTIDRKGFDLVFESFLEAFQGRSDVCMVIKDMGTQSFYRYGNHRARVLEAIHRGHDGLIYMDDTLTPGQLASLYCACDCLVAPYRGEGFGLPILKAMACGLPAIVPQGGASDDFVDDESGFLLAADQVECEHPWRLAGPATQLTIDPAELKRVMRRAVERRSETTQKGAAAAASVHARFTWDQAVEKMVERISALAEKSASKRKSHGLSAPRVESHVITPSPPTLSLCMLAAGEDGAVARALGRIRPFVDEAILLDIGENGRTADVAAEYGARVYRGTLSDSVSALRNAALAKATCDWVLVLDEDECLDDKELKKARDILPTCPSEVAGVECEVHAEGEQYGRFDRQIRLLRNESDIVFERRALEDIVAAISRTSRQVVSSDIRLVRRTESEVPFRCPHLLLRLLRLDASQRPTDPAVLWSLGGVHFDLGNFFHAECYLQESLARLSDHDPRYRLVAAHLIESHLQKGDPERAREVAEATGLSEHQAWLRSRLLGQEPAQTRLYLGAGTKRLPGYVHVDVHAGDGIDVAHDLNARPWPWDDGSVDLIVAEDVVEHLSIDLIQFCDEAWRVLKGDGELFIRTPHYKGDSSWIDPTHRWHLDERAFEFLDPETHWGTTQPHYSAHKWRIASLGIRGPQNIHALLVPRK